MQNHRVYKRQILIGETWPGVSLRLLVTIRRTRNHSNWTKPWNYILVCYHHHYPWLLHSHWHQYCLRHHLYHLLRYHPRSTPWLRVSRPQSQLSMIIRAIFYQTIQETLTPLLVSSVPTHCMKAISRKTEGCSASTNCMAMLEGKTTPNSNLIDT